MHRKLFIKTTISHKLTNFLFKHFIVVTFSFHIKTMVNYTKLLLQYYKHGSHQIFKNKKKSVVENKNSVLVKT